MPHVFVSRARRRAVPAPEQVDAGLAGASSQPVIAAGNGGVLLVAFINGGTLYVVDRASATAGVRRAAAARRAAPSNPSIQMSNLGKAYLAFTVADGAGHDVRAAYYYERATGRSRRRRSNAVAAADDAGTGSGRARPWRPPATASAIVAWGEGGHVYSRRVWGTAPSVVYEQADIPSLVGLRARSRPASPAVGGRRRLLLRRRRLPGGARVRRQRSRRGC